MAEKPANRGQYHLPLQSVSRGQGCYNCISWSPDRGKELWAKNRERDLNNALQISLADPLGETHPAVVNTRRMVDVIDHAVAQGQLGLCLVGGSQADLVAGGYLCGKWTGAQGASIAREGRKLDKLPEELMDDVEHGEKIKP